MTVTGFNRNGHRRLVAFHWGKTRAFAGIAAKFRLACELEGTASTAVERRQAAAWQRGRVSPRSSAPGEDMAGEGMAGEGMAGEGMAGEGMRVKT